jgi:hypothetical protein
MKLWNRPIKHGIGRAGPLLLGPIVLIACVRSGGSEATGDTGESATEQALAVACKVVDINGNVFDNCEGGAPPQPDGGDGGAPPTDGSAYDASPPVDPPIEVPECDGEWPKIQTPEWKIDKSFKRSYKCPNGTKAGLNFGFSASASGNASLATCSAKATVTGDFTFVPELCGRVKGGGSATLNGSLGACLTPDCSTFIPLCKGPLCTTRNVAMDATAFIEASWGVGEILPQARPFCDNGVVSCTVTVRLEGQGHASYDGADGTGTCGCCPNGNSREVIAANGELTGTVTGEINVDVGWLGRANLTVQGQACVGGYIKTGQSCDGPVSEMGGGWQLNASASGQACLGSGWFEYCRGFSAGPWTVGPGCDAPGGGEGEGG